MSDGFTLKGSVKVIGEVMTFDSGFTKRELVVTTDDDRYPQDIKVEFVKDKCAMLDSLKEGDKVVAHFDLRGNEYNGKYYTSLIGWRIESAGGDFAEQAQSHEREKFPVEDGDDLPW